MDQVHVVRHKVLAEGRAIRAVAREMGVSRNTVRRYLEQPAPVRTEITPRAQPTREAVEPRILEILEASPKWTGGKQRLTAARVHELVLAQGVMVGATVVKAIVAEWKRKRREVFVPLVYAPGDLAQVDFFEVLVDVGGTRRKAWMFVMRLMCSGRDFAWLYERQDQVSFLDGHVRAFAHWGAVPHRIAYDNLKAAVAKILAGSARVLTARFQALASHYVFEPSFCRPGTGHDKGGVESRGRAIRWQDLVPIPSGESLGAISTEIVARLDAGQAKRRDGQTKTIGELFALERGRMLPLAEYPFRSARIVFAGVSRRSLVKVEGAYYSVPSDWAGLDVEAHIGTERVEILGPGGARVEHPRKRLGERAVDYRHYVRELSHKPQALRQVAAELVGDLGEPYGAVWRHLVDVHGPRDAARVFAKVLVALERDGGARTAARLTGALERGEPIGLAIAPAPPARARDSLEPEHLPQSLCAIEVDRGSAADYDRWLSNGGGA